MTSASPSPAKDWQSQLYRHPLAWVLLLACAHVISRVAISDGMKWDESEQILWSQQFLLGYGAQPPAYSWLQWLVGQLLGPTVLSLSLVKHSLIVLTYVLAWQTGRALLPANGAFWVAGGLLLMLPFGWDSVRDQTHTILVTAMTFGAWWMALRQVRSPALVNFVGLGIFCGVGMLAKYSFAMLIGVFAVAAFSVPQVRRALLGRGWWLAPLIGLLIFAPHGYWLLHHWREATTETIHKMDISTQVSHLKGLGALAAAVFSTLGLWLLVSLASYRSRLWKTEPAADAALPEWRVWAWPLLWRYLALVFAILVGMVLVGDVSSFKQRWVLPLTAVAPLALYVWRPRLLADGVGRGYTTTVLVFALVFLTLATVRPWQSNLRKDPDELNHPVAQLSASLAAAGYDGQGVIVGSDNMVAAMLRSRNPRAYATACTAEFGRMADCLAQARAKAAQTGSGLLYIARMDKATPAWWEPVLATAPGAAIQDLTLPFSHMRASTPPMHYQFVLAARTHHTMKPVLVTGAAGFIGMHCALRLLERGLPVVGIDNLNSYYDVALKQARLAQLQSHPHFRFIQLDLADRAGMAALFDEIKPQRVLHLAAQAGVRYSIDQPDDYTDSNLLGFGHVLQGCRKHQVAHLVYASSSSVYGGNAKMPYAESDAVDHPISYYAATKKANELMAHTYSHLYQMPTTGLRFFTVYGPWGRPDMALFKFTKAMLAGETIDVYGNGQLVRDFTFIDDIVEGILRVLDKPATPDARYDPLQPNPGTSTAPYRIFNIGNSQPTVLMDYIAALESALGMQAHKRMLPIQPGDMHSTSADTRALQAWVQFAPSFTVTDGIQRFVDWYRSFYRV